MADEYIRREDAVKRLDPYRRFEIIQDAIDYIESLEPADVVKVVRCKDCKHHAYDEIFSCYWCEYPGRVRDTTPDGFCEKGEE